MKLTRRGFLAWAMAVAVSLHIYPSLVEADSPAPITDFVPEDCYSSFPICFRLHFIHKPSYKVYLPVTET